MGPKVAELEERARRGLPRTARGRRLVRDRRAPPGRARARHRKGGRGARPRLHVPGDSERRRARRRQARARGRRPGDDEHRPRARRRGGHAADEGGPGGAPVRPPARLEELPSDVPLLEDAAGALGARRRGKPCGGLGVLGCLSFHPRKIVTTGEGGAVTTDDDEIADAVRRLRHHGIDRTATSRSPRRAPTTGSRTSSARSGSRSCAGSRSCSRRATRLAEAYGERLDGIVQVPGVDRATGTAGRPTSSSSTGATRRSPRCAGRGSRPDRHVCPPPALRLRRPGTVPGGRPGLERALALPFHTQLTEDEIDRVVDALRAFA